MVFRDLDKQALKANSYTVLSKITLLNDGSVFTEDDHIIDWNYEDYRYVPNTGFIGQFVERILDGNLQDIPNNKIFENQEINLQIGIVNAIDNQTTWYDYGDFLITKVTKEDTTGNYTFESSDYTKKFNAVYEDTIQYPCLAMELANNVCGQAGLYLDTVNSCYYYIIGEDGLSAGNYSFNINSMYNRFTLNEDLIKNDVLMFVASTNQLVLKKVRDNTLSREVVTYVVAPSTGDYTLLTTRTTDYADFTNNDFVIENNQYDEDDTLRKVMQDIGKLAYSWIRVGEDNKVHIDFVQANSVDTYDELTTDEYYVSKKSDLPFGPVNKVVLGMSNIEGESLYRTSSTYTEETECAIKIYDNNLTYTEELRAIALNGCERLFGIQYMPLEIETIGHPWLNANEMIKLTNVDGEELYTYPFNRTIKYAGYIDGIISSETGTIQESKYEYESEIVKQINKTSIVVDKNSQTITALVSDVSDAQSDITTLQQTTNSLTATVEHLDEEYEQNVVVRRDAEGNPIEVEDAGNYELEDFKIYGGTSQDGEPTPSNPVDIDTVTSKTTTVDYSGSSIDIDYSYDQGLVKVEESDKEFKGNTYQEQTPGNNLLDRASASENKGLAWAYGTLFDETGSLTSDYIKVSIGDKYIQTYSSQVMFYDINKDYLGCLQSGGTTIAKTTGNNWTSFTVPNVNDIYYMRLGYRASVGGNPSTLIDKSIMLNKGTTLLPYEPYTYGPTPNSNYPQPIQVATGLQDVNVCGKNLFDVAPSSTDNYQNTFFIQNISDNNITLIGYGGNTSKFIRLQNFEANGDYTVSYNFTQTYNRLLVRLRNENDSGWLTNSDITWSGWTYNTAYGAWFKDFPSSNNPVMNITIPNALYWQLGFVNVGTNANTYSNIMLLKGTYTSSNLPTYEPFLEKKTYPINLGKNLVNIADFDQNLTNTYYINTNLNYKIEANTYYTLSFDANSTVEPFQIQVGLCNVGGYYATDIGYKANNYNGRVYITFSTTQEKIDSYTNNLLARFVRYGTQTTATIRISNVQLERGVIPSNYAPYFTPIELCKINDYKDRIFKGVGSNLLNVSASESGGINASGVDVSGTTLWRSTGYIEAKPNTTYTMTSNRSGMTVRLYEYDDTHTFISPRSEAFGTLTITTTANTKYLRWSLYNAGNTITQNDVNGWQLQINEGSAPLPYEPYLAKGKWYIEKKIGKVDLSTGYYYNNIGWSMSTSTTTGLRAFWFFKDYFPELNISASVYEKLSNYFTYKKEEWKTVSSPCLCENSGLATNMIIFSGFNDITSVDSWRNWLSTHPTIVYYVLGTPTYTEITNEELISQLETLNTCEFYSNITHYTTTSSNLPLISNFSISDLPYKVITISDEDNNSYAFKPLFRNLELCKIGDYIDYLYRQDGKWYKHSEIGKVVLDGSESWANLDANHRSYITYINLGIIPKAYSSDCLSNYFVNANTEQYIGFNLGASSLYLRIDNSFTNITQFKNWLSTYKPVFYFRLATPTETEITDEEIILELNRLMLQPLYRGYNEIYLNDDVCDKLSIRYLTDSIFNDTYATKSQLSVTNENVSALVTRSSLMEDNITNLTLGINNISTEVTSVQNVTADLENSINYLNVDMSGNSIIIPTSSENKPYVSTTYQIPYNATFKGEVVNPTVNTSSASVTGITLSFTTGFVNVTVNSTTAIPTATNSFLINFTYTNDGKTYLVSKTLNVALSVEGKDGKDGTSVTILGSYNTLADLQAAHPTGNAGDSYMVGTDLYVWDVSSSSWKDVGQIKGTDGISTYFYVRYSENADGNPMTASPTSSSKYIGVCSTTSSTAPTSYTAYTWSKYAGDNGETTYLHIKYSEDGSTFVPASEDAAEGDTPSSWVGVLTDTNETASTIFDDYTWYKFTEDIDNQLTELQNQISQNSTDIGNNYTAIIEKLNDYAKAETLATLTQTVETNQTNTEYAISVINDLQVNGVSQVRTEKGFTFDNNGMTIDATNSITKSVTDTNGIQVIDKSGSQESELLFAGYDETTQSSIVRTENLSVSTYFNIGTKSRFEDYKNGTGVFI